MLDVGCGTGVFACRLAQRGIVVVGIDPASASIEIARTKSSTGLVTWICGDATGLPPLTVDMATMTGNVAQVFVHDADWSATLLGVRRALRDGGYLVFETRDPGAWGWENGGISPARSGRPLPRGRSSSRDLAAAGFDVIDVRDAPDRPGRRVRLHHTSLAHTVNKTVGYRDSTARFSSCMLRASSRRIINMKIGKMTRNAPFG